MFSKIFSAKKVFFVSLNFHPLCYVFFISPTQSNLKSTGKKRQWHSSTIKVYFLKSFLSFSMYYVSLEFVSGLFATSLSVVFIGSYTTWIECALADPAAAVAMLCWCAQLSDVTFRDFMRGGVLLLIDEENAKPRRRVALLVNGREKKKKRRRYSFGEKLIKHTLTE